MMYFGSRRQLTQADTPTAPIMVSRKCPSNQIFDFQVDLPFDTYLPTYKVCTSAHAMLWHCPPNMPKVDTNQSVISIFFCRRSTAWPLHDDMIDPLRGWKILPSPCEKPLSSLPVPHRHRSHACGHSPTLLTKTHMFVGANKVANPLHLTPHSGTVSDTRR